MYETLISIDELSALMQTGQKPSFVKPIGPLVIVDCRFSLANVQWGRMEYDAGHIPGALYAHCNEDLSGEIIPGKTGRHPLPEQEQFLEWVMKSGITNNSQIVAYDQAGGGYAARLWWLMRWMGHHAVAVLDGGWDAWKKAGLPSDKGVLNPKRSTYSPSWRNDLIVTIDEVEQWACDVTHTVVDSREAIRYAGLEEKIDPVAGHIPGAINKPYGENTNADGTWKSAETLRRRFASLVTNTKCDDIAFYCGSGVTACHNVLAFKHAGLGDARLYPGSWSEWITDPNRAVDVDTEGDKVRM